jgi:hypothetical protein
LGGALITVAKTLSTLDPELRKIYDSLVEEVTLVTLKWLTAKDLFGHSKERSELLDRTAGNFFNVCQSTFRSDVFIALTRLTGPMKSHGKDNLCLKRLLKHLDSHRHPKFAADLEKQIVDASQLCEPFVDHRNRKLAHLDFGLALDASSAPLPTITVAQVNVALKSVQDIVNNFGRYFLDATTYFDEIFQSKGVSSLVYYLQRGEHAANVEKEEKLEQFRRPRPSDK